MTKSGSRREKGKHKSAKKPRKDGRQVPWVEQRKVLHRVQNNLAGRKGAGGHQEYEVVDDGEVCGVLDEEDDSSDFTTVPDDDNMAMEAYDDWVTAQQEQQYKLPNDDYQPQDGEDFDDNDLEDAAYLSDEAENDGDENDGADDEDDIRSMLKHYAKQQCSFLDDEISDDDDDDSLNDPDFIPNDDEMLDVGADDPQLEEFVGVPSPALYFDSRQKLYEQSTAQSGVDSITRGMELLRLRRESGLPLDDLLPLYDGTAMTRGDCARKVLHILGELKCAPSEDNIRHILQGMRATMPQGKDFPFDLSEKSLKKKICAYSMSHNNKLYIEITICINGCFVFGEEGIGENKSLGNCPICQAARYKMSSRTPEKTIHYRPLIPLIQGLLEDEMFVQSMAYETLQTIKDGVIQDLLDGDEIQEQLGEMETLYAQHCVGNEDPSAVRMMNIVLGEFWDGAQVHSTVYSTFYPLFVSFNNLPPTMRGVVGVGTFLLALDTMNKPATRDFIFKRCLLPELRKLEGGIEMKSTTSAFFVQARMLLHGFDTKAFESVMCVQASTSKAPCPMCTTTVGTYRIDHCVYIGNRGYLPRNNFLRSLGEYGKDYPENFFTESDCAAFYEPNTKAIDAHHALHKLAKDGSRPPLSLKDIPLDTFSSSLKTAHVNDVSAMLASMPSLDKQKQRKFTADSFAIDHILVERVLTAVSYQYADFRELVHKKASHEYYMENALQYGLSGDKKKRKKKLDPVNGSTGAYYGVSLRSVNISKHANFDPFHAFQGLAKILIQNISGERNYSKKQATDTMCHDYSNLTVEPKKQSNTNETKRAASAPPAKKAMKRRVKVSEAPWVFRIKQQNKCDVFVECLLIPVGAADHFEVKKLPFKRSGYLKGIARIQFISYVLPTFISTLADEEYPDAYRAYFEIAAMILKGLCSPVFTRESIEKLWHKVALYLSIHEGIFPISECSFLSHELLDIPRFIAKYGPVRCWWALYGERALSRIKQFIPQGGQSYQHTTVEQYMLSEETSTRKFYCSVSSLQGDKDVIEVQHGNTDGKQHKQYTIYSKLFSCRLYRQYTLNQTKRMQKAASKLSLFELNQLLECLTLEIEDHFMPAKQLTPSGGSKIVYGLDHALQESSYYRVFYHYCKHIKPASAVNYTDPLFSCDKFVLWLLSTRDVDAAYSSLQVQELPAASSSTAVSSEIRRILDSGKIIFTDFMTTINEIRYLNVELYRIGVLQGTRMNTRGWECRETEPMSQSGLPGNRDANILKNMWFEKKHYSSWCTITAIARKPNVLSRNIAAIQSKFTKNQPPRLSLFAQINVFMILNLPSDRFLHRHAFVSVTCRRNLGDHRHKIGCIDQESMVEEISFIPMKDMKPIRFGVVGYDALNKPFSIKTKFFKDKTLYAASEDKTTAHHLVLCELDGANETLHGCARNEIFKFSAVGASPQMFKLHVEEVHYE